MSIFEVLSVEKEIMLHLGGKDVRTAQIICGEISKRFPTMEILGFIDNGYLLIYLINSATTIMPICNTADFVIQSNGIKVKATMNAPREEIQKINKILQDI